METKQLGRHLSNIFDHRGLDAKAMHLYSYEARSRGAAAMDKEWQHHLDWINKAVIGPPKATESYTVSRLREMGMIGIYSSELEK